MAAVVTEEFGRKVSAGNVQFLVEKQLRPLGVLAQADGSSPEIEKADPLLALKFRVALVPERAVGAVTTIFKPLFWPPVMVVALAAIVGLDVWLLFIHGIGQGVRQAVYQPLLLRDVLRRRGARHGLPRDRARLGLPLRRRQARRARAPASTWSGPSSTAT